jgi:hypothetical protein
MKSLPMFFSALSSVVLAGALTGCAAPALTQANAAPAVMHHGADGSRMGMMDMQAMCEQHRAMMSNKTPEARQAMMTAHMKSMSPEQMQQHMQMMQEQCK